jgi:hypothetical protein
MSDKPAEAEREKVVANERWKLFAQAVDRASGWRCIWRRRPR